MKKVNKAFSIAEAFIMLTIVSVALAAAAPMITKQIKHNNLSNVQTNILGREINQAENRINVANANIQNIVGAGRTPEQYAQYIASLEARISALEELDIENLQSQIDSKVNNSDLSQVVSKQISGLVDNAMLDRKATDLKSSLTSMIASEIKKIQDEFKVKMIPSGAIVFFDSTSCPDTTNWIPLSSIYPQASGAFIRNLGESNRTKGSYQAGAVPDIQLALRSDYGNQLASYYSIRLSEYGADDWGGYLGGSPTGGSDEYMYQMNSAAKKYRAGDLIKTNPDVYDKNVMEVRPNNIAFIACRKK